MSITTNITAGVSKMKEDEARNMVLLNRTALITSCVTKTRENQSIWRTAEMTIKSYFHPLNKQASKCFQRGLEDILVIHDKNT